MVFEKHDECIFCGIVNNWLTRRASCKCTLKHAASHSVRANSYSAVSSGTITSSEKIIFRVYRSGLPVAWSLCNKFLLLEKKQQWNILQQTWHQHQTAMQHRLIATMLVKWICFSFKFINEHVRHCTRVFSPWLLNFLDSALSIMKPSAKHCRAHLLNTKRQGRMSQVHSCQMNLKTKTVDGDGESQFLPEI